MKTLIKDGLPQLLDLVRINFERDGRLTTVLFVNYAGVMQIFALFWQNDDDKEATSNMLSKMVASGNVYEYALVAECWALKASSTEDFNEVMGNYRPGAVERHPRRVEVCSVMYCSSEEEIMHMAEIEEKSRVVGEWSIVGEPVKHGVNPAQFQSKFNDMFRRAVAGNN